VLLGSGRHVPRCLLVWAIGSAALAGAALTARPAAAEAWTAARTGTVDLLPFDRAIGDLAAAVAVGCAVWAWLTMTVTVVDAARGRHPACGRGGARRPVPHGVRRLVLAACGVAIVSASAPPALADHGAPGPVHGAARLSGLPLPDRAVAPARSTTARSHPAASPHTVVVSSGDTLWSIAAGGLPAGASDQRITTRWHRLYDANRDRIGPDPDVIEPGQRLDLPPERPPRKDRT
jgi:nucleoid-associated protein YgaU